MAFVIGVDGGGTKTEAVVLDEQAHVRGRGYAGPANHHQVGRAGVRAAVEEATAGALRAAGISMDDVVAVAWGLAGVDRPYEVEQFQSLAEEMYPHLPTRVDNDAIAALVGGVGREEGVVLIAGTGMIAYGVGEDGRRQRAGGWGYQQDKGNGYFLGFEGMRAAMWAHDGTDISTTLHDAILNTLALDTAQDMISWLYAPDRQVHDIAALAPVVLEAAQAGDPAAAGIVAQGVDALANAVASVARRLSFAHGEVPVAFAGSLLTRSPFYREMVEQAIRTRVPGARVLSRPSDPAVGAGLMAWALVGRHPILPGTDAGNISHVPWASEEPNVLTRGLDALGAWEIVGLMHVEDRRAVDAVRRVLSDIARVVDVIVERMERGGRLIYVGAGTSGRLGVLDASECPPTFGVSPDKVMGLIAGGNLALTTAIEGAEDDAQAGARDVSARQVNADDVVVGIAASGRTPYVLGALEEARRRGAITVGVICNLPAPVADLAHYTIAPLVGPEVISGSTRLKAGTAQKLVLNMLSTATMVRLGKVYDNLMVDVQPANRKLQARALRIIMATTGLDEQQAREALSASGGDVKVAIVSALLGCSPNEARERLLLAGGRIRNALEPRVLEEESSQILE